MTRFAERKPQQEQNGYDKVDHFNGRQMGECHEKCRYNLKQGGQTIGNVVVRIGKRAQFLLDKTFDQNPQTAKGRNHQTTSQNPSQDFGHYPTYKYVDKRKDQQKQGQKCP